ncbi:MAG: guanylate kinase [Oscillospiraceae bacterium]|nr:guanylate kinase [Oscillospiraceae bacterium]
MKRGRLIVVSAPSGCGKGTILGRVLQDRERFFYSVSATTRAPREGEENGVHYLFYTREAFERCIKGELFLEYAEYCGNYYGTPLAPIEVHLNMGQDVILEIEVQGAMQIREKRPDASFIFIAPPSPAALRERLTNRGTEDAETIEKRVQQAEKELTCVDAYDYCVINDDLDTAVADFLAVVRAIELKVK